MITDIVKGAGQTVSSITTGWIEKLIISGTLIAIEKHCVIFVLFTMVVFIDLLAKWIALAYKELVHERATDRSLLSCIKAIPEAHRKGIINSYAMKTQFVGKIIVYADNLTGYMHRCRDKGIRRTCRVWYDGSCLPVLNRTFINC